MYINCPICGMSDQGAVFNGDNITCPRCGKYRITDSAAEMLASSLKGAERKVANVSGWIREHQNELINSDTVKQLLELPSPSLAEKSLRLLRYLEKRTSYLGQRLSYVVRYKAIAWVVSDDELEYVFDYLEACAYISKEDSGNFSYSDYYVTPAGFTYLEQAKNSNANSQIGFCAMWFDSSMSAIWNDAIDPAILAAGYEPKRIDEHPHNNRIDDEIISLIRRSKFVVADFTGQRGGVYFEAGFALGLNLPVIWTVKKSELASVHFDNRQYNFVTWEENKLPEFKLDLQYRIEATLGRGKYQSS